MHMRMAELIGMAAALSFFALSASATDLTASLQTCTTAGCGATVLIGRLNKSDRCCGFANLSMPWIAQLYAKKNECLRLQITAQGATDTELVAIAPGTQRAWQNDNSGLSSCTTCPLLKIQTGANEQGWFLVQVNQKTGVAGDSAFTLRYSRYAADNPNCSTPTPPLP